MPPPPLPEGRPNLEELTGKVRVLGCLLAVLVTFPLLVCGSVPLLVLGQGEVLWYLGSEPFDVTNWQEGGPERRQAMAWGLRSALVEMKPEEVEERLGPPGEKQQEDEDAGEIWYYDLGEDRFRLLPNSEKAVLVVRFRQGRVERAWKSTWGGE